MVKCLNCGKDVEEGVSVCPNCGTSIRTVEIGAGKKTKGSKKKFIFLAVGLVILFAVILAVIMLIGGKKKRPVMEDGSHAYIDVDGNAYCYNGNGKLIIVEGEWVGGSITGDGKHIVLIDMEKNIYCFNGKGKKGLKSWIRLAC